MQQLEVAYNVPSRRSGEERIINQRIEAETQHPVQDAFGMSRLEQMIRDVGAEYECGKLSYPLVKREPGLEPGDDDVGPQDAGENDEEEEEDVEDENHEFPSADPMSDVPRYATDTHASHRHPS
jgi:hypothetical protein